MFTLFTLDLVLGNKELTMFSIDPADQRTDDNETEFELYSDRIMRTAPTYHIVIEEAQRVGLKWKLTPGPNTPTVNLKQMFDILLSKDLSRNAELDWIKNEGYRFLDGERIDGLHTAFTSFPRSGNTMLRRWFEQLTGIFSGSDNDMRGIFDL